MRNMVLKRPCLTRRWITTIVGTMLIPLLGLPGLAANPPGYPSRDADLDVLPGFRMPPAGYGEVSFYWWLGDPLTRDRLTWQLDQLAGKGLSALQVNYAHSDKGGLSYGLTYPSDPALFSEPWWELFSWFLGQARQRGMAVSLSDYTLGWAGNGWYIDEILRDHPEIHGAALARELHDCSGQCNWEVPAGALSIRAYLLKEEHLSPDTSVDLRTHLHGRTLQWDAPQGRWRLIAVYPKEVLLSLDPMHPQSGKQMIEKFFQRFEDRNPGESGQGLNFFFSDELSFGIHGWLWNGWFAGEFRKRKGYDVVPELSSLFEETGPRAVKIRLDYSDVMVSLEEENYFRPLYEWHRSRGMIYGCDHGGRGKNVTEFGDYFRTQRWMTGPGNDQPNLASDVIKNKVASSIAHLYQRPRTWLEGYYGSGWGTTSAQVVDATWRNFAQGQNLLTLHGLYYSTHGGWWEWAPPCNHFRMPYWAHMGEFLHAVERMSYLLSQGVHRADVAILYPVAAVEAAHGGKEAVETAFSLGRQLYDQGIDFDFLDFESLAQATVEDKKLKVAGEEYRALVLPAMKAVRHSTLERAVEFHRAGGKVILLGAAPQASERLGDQDPQVQALVAQLPSTQVWKEEEAIAGIQSAFPRDFVCRTGSSSQPSILHRQAGARTIYLVYGAGKGTECRFRSTGRVELWDPWTGATSPLSVLAQSDESTTLRMPLESTEAQIIVFQPGKADLQATGERKSITVPLVGDWEFELKPTLDNRYGDYRLPATPSLIRAEARRFRYTSEGAEKWDGSDPKREDSLWPETTCSYGPGFWKLGPLPITADVTALEKQLTSLNTLDPSSAVMIGGKQVRWQPYEFSLRWGVENDPGHQGYHGLKEEVSNDFIALGSRQFKSTTTVYTEEEGGSRYYLWTSVVAPRDLHARITQGGDLPAAAWINHTALPPGTPSVALKGGGNPLLLRYDQPSRGHFLLMDPESPTEWKQGYPLASLWYQRPGVLPFDIYPQKQQPAGWYRTLAPPGLRGMKFSVLGRPTVWIDGQPMDLTSGKKQSDGTVEYSVPLHRNLTSPVRVAIRVEQERGSYAGAAFPQPISYDCGTGYLSTGDWSRIDGLASYSGGAWYRRDFALSAEQSGQKIWLDLGQVSASAEVLINGKTAGAKLAPPYRFEISSLVQAGSNRVEVLVYSALSNHYQTIPTRYRRPSPSGLLGPVQLILQP